MNRFCFCVLLVGKVLKSLLIAPTVIIGASVLMSLVIALGVFFDESSDIERWMKDNRKAGTK